MSAHEVGKDQVQRVGADAAKPCRRDGMRYEWLEDSGSTSEGPYRKAHKPNFIYWCKEAGPIGPLLYLFDLLVYHLARIGEDR